jgi:hypothetical protein
MMTASEQELSRVLREWGGPLSLDVLEDPFRGLLEELSESFQIVTDRLRKYMHAPWGSRQVRLVFADSDDLNAFAKKEAACDYVVITRGAVEQIYGCMLTIMSSPSALPEIGDVSKEEEPRGAFRNGFPPLPLLRRDRQLASVAVYHPSDTARMAFGMQLASSALHFLMWHEVGHVFGGHLELITAGGFGATIVERGTPSSPPIPPPLRHVFEVDADTFAAHSEGYTSTHPELGESLTQTFQWKGVAPPDAQFIATGIAIGVLFRLLHPDGPAPVDDRNSTHPHPAVRGNLALSRAISLGIQAKRFEPGDLFRLVPRSLGLVETIWSSFDLPGRREGTTESWIRQVRKLSDELAREYGARANLLRSHARLPTAWWGQWRDDAPIAGKLTEA